MQMGRVVGNVVATRKDERLTGYKLMIIQSVDEQKNPQGCPMIAVDTVGAGIGELVLFTKGTSARLAANKTESPIDAAIIGIIDYIDVYEEFSAKEQA